MLSSLPRLKNAFIQMQSCGRRGGGCDVHGPWHQEPNDFLPFAFSERRQDLLWKEVEKRLQAKIPW
jgi:hypothetical protein